MTYAKQFPFQQEPPLSTSRRCACGTLSHPFKSVSVHPGVHTQYASDRAHGRISQLNLATLNHPDRSCRQLRGSTKLRLRHSRQHSQVSGIDLAGIEAHYIRYRDIQDSTHATQNVDLRTGCSGFPKLDSPSSNTGQSGQGSHGHVASCFPKCGGIESAHHSSAHVSADRLLAPMRRHCAALPLDSRVVAIEQRRFRLRTLATGGLPTETR